MHGLRKRMHLFLSRSFLWMHAASCGHFRTRNARRGMSPDKRHITLSAALGRLAASHQLFQRSPNPERTERRMDRMIREGLHLAGEFSSVWCSSCRLHRRIVSTDTSHRSRPQGQYPQASTHRSQPAGLKRCSAKPECSASSHPKELLNRWVKACELCKIRMIKPLCRITFLRSCLRLSYATTM